MYIEIVFSCEYTPQRAPGKARRPAKRWPHAGQQTVGDETPGLPFARQRQQAQQHHAAARGADARDDHIHSAQRQPERHSQQRREQDHRSQHLGGQRAGFSQQNVIRALYAPGAHKQEHRADDAHRTAQQQKQYPHCAGEMLAYHKCQHRVRRQYQRKRRHLPKRRFIAPFPSCIQVPTPPSDIWDFSG